MLQRCLRKLAHHEQLPDGFADTNIIGAGTLRRADFTLQNTRAAATRRQSL